VLLALLGSIEKWRRMPREGVCAANATQKFNFQLKRYIDNSSRREGKGEKEHVSSTSSSCICEIQIGNR